jgi:hypothetical protein
MYLLHPGAFAPRIATVTLGSQIDPYRIVAQLGMLPFNCMDWADGGPTKEVGHPKLFVFTKLKRLSGPEVASVFQRFGFFILSQRGSHIKP